MVTPGQRELWPQLSPAVRALVETTQPAGVARASIDSMGADDWGHLLWLATRERALGPVYRYLTSQAAGKVPEDTLARFRSLAMVADFQLRYLAERASATIVALADAGIPVILLKGAGIGLQLHGDLVTRPMGDVDLLVHQQDLAASAEIAAAGGWVRRQDVPSDEVYQTHHHLAPMIDGDGVGVGLELHFGLFATGHPFRTEVDSLWEDAEPMTLLDLTK